MAHIVIDARELRTSTGRYVERLLHYLQKIDNQHVYTVLLQPKDIDGWQPSNPNFSKLACPHKEFTFDEQIGLLKQVRGLNADLVHFAIVQQPILYSGKVVTTIHDLTTLRFYNPDKKRTSFMLKQAVYAQVVKRAARKSKVIITPTEFVKSDLVQFSGISSDKVVVTLEAADPITEAPTAPLLSQNLTNKQFIMYVGRPTPHKNLERLIEAHALLRAQRPNLLLVLAGKKDANYERIEADAHAKGHKGVIFTDFISDGELRWLYENCQAYVFPSLSEGFGLPPLEAMAHGAPVVSSNATCLPEVNGDAAHYFDPTDVQSMADSVNEVLTNKQLRQKLIRAGDHQFKKFSWERMARQTLDVYNRALEN